MSVRVTHRKIEGEQLCEIKPQTHDWLARVDVYRSSDGLRVSIVPRAPDKYYGINGWLKNTGRLVELLPASEKPDVLMPGDGIRFKAGPDTLIGTILKRAQLPKDVRDAVTAELGKRWGKY